MDHLIDYNFARALHIIAVIAWIAGLLMLPRFYAYITASTPGGELETAMLKAARSLRLIIVGPAFMLSWALGLFLFAAFLMGDLERPFPDIIASVPHWFWIKLVLVLGLSFYQIFLSSAGRQLAAGKRRHSERFWRLTSEIPFLVAIAAVLLATMENDLIP